eukprot:INCI19155.2.p1 GENE.INCI19155.2~~INCI19155.2.p1  ORF type:complete len:152 (-),score=16.48 INCI19155.2:58-513(-)
MRLVALMGLVGIHQAFALRLRSNRQLFLLDGPDDEQSGCRSDCFGHGACDAKKGTCSCETQWHGELCGSTFLHGTSGKRDYSAEVTIVPDGTSFSIDLDGFTTADLFAKLGHLHAVLQQVGHFVLDAPCVAHFLVQPRCVRGCGFRVYLCW